MSKHVYGLVISIILLLVVAPSEAQPKEELPYLYYYSLEQQAFLIERADGTDRQFLASYELPEGHTMIDGVGWSPSGAWFAWSSSSVGGAGGDKSVFLTNQDTVLSLFPVPNPRSIDMAWSPREDLLLVSYFPNPEAAVQDILVFDPQSSATLFHAHAAELTSDPAYWLRHIDWSPDGRYIALENGRTLELVTLSGDTHITIVTPDMGFSGCSDFGMLPYWISEEVMVYLDETSHDLVFENPQLPDSRRTAKLPDGQIKLVDWSPDNNHALIYVQPFPDDNRHELWLLSTQDLTVDLVEDTVTFLDNCNAPFDESLWGGSDHAVFVTEDKQIQALSISPDETMSFRSASDIRVRNLAPIRWADERTVLFVGQRQSDKSPNVYAFDLESGSVTELALSETGESVFVEYVSPVQYGHVIFDNWIFDVTTGTRKPLLANPQSYGLSRFAVRYVEWHPTENWLFALGAPYDTWPMENVPMVYVTDANGAIQRQLSPCLPNATSCYGWLPERAN
jgi:WD40 repeat protein